MTSRRLWIPMALLAALASFAALASGCSHDRGAAKADAAPTDSTLLAATDVARVTRTDLRAGVPVSGTLEPVLAVHVTAPYPEMIERVLVREGQSVRKGQVLARFRASALAPLAASATAERKSRAAEYERQKNLFKEGAVSERDVESAEAQLRAAEAAEAEAAKRLDDATVRAPFDGVVATRAVQSGDRVGDGDPLLDLVNVSELEFEATVPSEYVGRVRPGAPVSLSVTGFPAGSIAGKVARVNASADPATRQIKLYVSVPNPDRRLVGGLFASGRVALEEAKAALAVPTAALRAEAGKTYVLTVENGRLARHDVTPGVRDESQDLVEIRAGLGAGQTVLTGPAEGLEVGEPVKVAGGGR